METSLKVAKFMESPHRAPLLRPAGTHHRFLFSPKHEGCQLQNKTCMKATGFALARGVMQITSSQ